VAADASRVRTRQIVIAVHVTARACNRRVRACKREPGCRVIEGCTRPVRGAVALLASLREARRDVIRIGRALEIF